MPAPAAVLCVCACVLQAFQACHKEKRTLLNPSWVRTVVELTPLVCCAAFQEEGEAPEDEWSSSRMIEHTARLAATLQLFANMKWGLEANLLP